MFSFLDPNTWEPTTHEFRIYLDDGAQTWCVVDEEDYVYFSRWRWHINKPHATRSGKKQYACRNQSNGKRYAPTLYLHVEIYKRTGLLPPSPLHVIVDHRDGNELNCRRANLRWATHSMNRHNINGCAPYDLLEDVRAQLRSQDTPQA